MFESVPHQRGETVLVINVRREYDTQSKVGLLMGCKWSELNNEKRFWLCELNEIVERSPILKLNPLRCQARQRQSRPPADDSRDNIDV